MAPLQGDLQIHIMRVLWRLGSGTVDEVRAELPNAERNAYTTVQTVLNRLAERGLLDRERLGKSFRYEPTLTEAEYVSLSLQQALDRASSDARQAALVELIGGLDSDELSQLRRRAKAIEKSRKKR